MPGDVIRLTIPASPTHTRLPRVAIAGLATRAGFSYDEVEDLRLAIGEVCQVLLDGDTNNGASLFIEYAVERGAMEVAVSTDGSPGPADDEGGLSMQILAATVDDLAVHDDGRRITFTKHAADDDD